jgi:acyl phosphate:glycerol-3-phosphate acyltransferase
MGVAVAIVVGYLLGTFPSADLVTRIATRGTVDIRAVGSGNPGTLNAIQSIGTTWGLVVLVLDMAKGVAAGFAGWALGGDAGAYLGATASIAGHIFPVWTRFRGGKGVATSAGACVAVFPAYVPIDLLVAFLGAARSRRAVVGTRVGCAVWTIAATLWWVFDWSNLWGPDPSGWLVVSAVLGSGMILWAFRSVGRPVPGGGDVA